VRDTVAALVRARRDDTRPGLWFEEQQWSWAEVVQEMETRAGLLLELAPEPPFHVGVLLDNVPEFLFLLGGAALSRRALVALNPTRSGAELVRDIGHTDCGAVVTDSTRIDAVRRLDQSGAPLRVVACDSPGYTDALARVRGGEAAPGTLAAEPDDLLLLIFTSGSTGAPKAVRMTQRRAASAAGQLGFGPDDVLYCAIPMFHGNALSSMVFPALGTGASLVLRRRFSASRFLPDIRERGVTFTSTVGRVLSYVLATPETAQDQDHKLKFVLGPESSAADVKAFRRRFRVPVFGGYGSSENAIVMVPVPGQPADVLGVPAPGLDVVVVDPETGKECPPALFDPNGGLLNAQEAVGELVGRNSLDRFEGYYNNAEATAARTRGGWYWSGDLAYRDEAGVFHFAGRTSDWLRVDGENFAAAPVERVLGRFPGVSGVAVVAVPDDSTLDDQVLAVLELRPTAVFDPGAFDAFLAEQQDLGSKWSPRYVRISAALPVTTTNKIDKGSLRRGRWSPADGGLVYWRPLRRDPLQLMDSAARDEIRRRFAAHGRLGVLD
jgi:fatty-acyl-CoA synthase